MERLYVSQLDKWKKYSVDRKWKKDGVLKVDYIKNGVILPTVSTGLAGGYMGGVVDEKGEFIAGSLRMGQNNNVNPGYCGVGRAYQYDKKVLEISNQKVIFGGVLVGHFGHLILDGFCRLWLPLKESDMKNKIVFITIKDVPSYFWDMIDALGIERERIVFLDKPTQYEEVIVPDESIHSWSDYSKEYVEIYEKMCSNLPINRDKTKIYLSRGNFSKYGNKSDICNERYFEEFFRNHGYEVVYPEEHSVIEQMTLMYNADEVVASCGSISHLFLFCKPGTKATILMKTEHEILIPQCIINEAKELDYCFVDVSMNFLFTTRVGGFTFWGPTKYWKKYVKDKFDEESSIDLSGEDYLEYIKNWCEFYSDHKRFKLIKEMDSFDFLNLISKGILNKELNRDDYGIEKKDSEAILSKLHEEKEVLFFQNKYLKRYCKENIDACALIYSLHKSKYGWTDYVLEGECTENDINCRVEAIKIKFCNFSSRINYTVYVKGLGWQNAVSDDQIAGTTGKRLSISAIKIWLDEHEENQFILLYRVNSGGKWTKWSQNGEIAGEANDDYIISDIQIKLVKL